MNLYPNVGLLPKDTLVQLLKVSKARHGADPDSWTNIQNEVQASLIMSIGKVFYQNHLPLHLPAKDWQLVCDYLNNDSSHNPNRARTHPGWLQHIDNLQNIYLKAGSHLARAGLLTLHKTTFQTRDGRKKPVLEFAGRLHPENFDIAIQELSSWAEQPSLTSDAALLRGYPHFLTSQRPDTDPWTIAAPGTHRTLLTLDTSTPINPVTWRAAIHRTRLAPIKMTQIPAGLIIFNPQNPALSSAFLTTPEKLPAIGQETLIVQDGALYQGEPSIINLIRHRYPTTTHRFPPTQLPEGQ